MLLVLPVTLCSPLAGGFGTPGWTGFMFALSFSRMKPFAMQPWLSRWCWCSGARGCWLAAAALGDITCKSTVCIIYPVININDRPSLTPGRDNEHQDCPWGCCRAPFLPSFPCQHHWGIAGVPPQLRGSRAPLDSHWLLPRAAGAHPAPLQLSTASGLPALPPDTGGYFHRSGFGTIYFFFSLCWFQLILVPLFFHGAGHLCKFLPSPCPGWLTGTNGSLASPKGSSTTRFGAINGLQP